LAAIIQLDTQLNLQPIASAVIYRYDGCAGKGQITYVVQSCT
jgi:hypothetical protein